MGDFLSVILPSFNPDQNRLRQTIDGLRSQTLGTEHWELILVDNNSKPAINIDLSWHPDHQLVTVARQGLTYARCKGFETAKGHIIIMVDDDNILDSSYLEQVRSIFASNPKLGAIGGKSVPCFETTPPQWIKEFYSNLALRDLGENILINQWESNYPASAPIGAGMGIRKSALTAYLKKISSGKGFISDRSGNNLTSGGDNDMVLEILKSGWETGYFPSLKLQHIIPEARTEVKYLAKLLNQTNQSWVQVLNEHGICPWNATPQWTLSLRKLKAWFTYRAWQTPAAYVRWQGACGLFDGLTRITDAKA